VAAAKSFVALSVCALTFVASAVADNAGVLDNPTVRITRADQARAVAALLSLRDFTHGWKGGRTSAHKLSAPSCPGFDPKESDLVVSGHADASFSYPKSAVTFDQDIQVLHSPSAVRTDFARTITPKFAKCLAYQLGKGKNVVSVRVDRVSFPPVGDVSAAFRATLTLQEGTRRIEAYEDFVFFGVGRVEYALNVLAPFQLASQLSPFESSMAQLLAKRATAKPCC
jgi:hypothetical protein